MVTGIRDRSALTIWLSFGAIVATGAVASYSQALIVVQAADGPTLISYAVAALADPTIFASGTNILDAREHGEGWPWLSVVSLVIGLAVTGYANVMAGDPHAVPEWLVRLWPAVAIALALHSLIDFRRRSALRRAARVTEAGVPCPHQVPGDLASAVTAAWEHAGTCLRRPVTYTEISAAFGLERHKVAAMVKGRLGNGSAPDG